MDQQKALAQQFEQHRAHLRAVAYRMLGSLPDADDAVQESWLRLSRADAGRIENLRAWLTTVVARVALNMLRARGARREQPLTTRVPDPVVDPLDGSNPEHETLLADSIGLALLVVLETLSPPERLAFVLHDMFAVPFDEIATIVERSPEAARQMASRARRRVRGAAPSPDADMASQWAVVDAFLTAARDGSFERLVSLLHPDVVLRSDSGTAPLTREIRGAEAVASQALTWSRVDLEQRRAVVNGAAGMIALRDGRAFSVMGLVIAEGRIVEMDILADPDRLALLDLAGTAG